MKQLYIVIFWGILCAAMYWLYRRGLAVTKSVTAVLFVFWPGKDADRAQLNSCTGRVRHAGRFRESRTYEFTFSAQLSKGDAEVILMVERKQPLLKLNRRSPAGSMELDGKRRYYLCWDFQNASGKCALRW